MYIDFSHPRERAFLQHSGRIVAMQVFVGSMVDFGDAFVPTRQFFMMDAAMMHNAYAYQYAKKL